MRRTLALTAIVGLCVCGFCSALAEAQGTPTENPDMTPPPPDTPASTPAPTPEPASSATPASSTAAAPEQPSAAAPSSAEAASASEASGIQTKGFWIETKIRSGASYSFLGGYTSISTYHLPGLLAGYKLDRLVIAMGLNLFVSHVTDKNDGTPDDKSTLVGGVLGPVVQFELARKGPMSLYGQGGLGFRFATSDDKDGDSEHEFRDYGFSLNLAAGARYFLHPSFALGAEIGANLDATWAKEKQKQQGTTLNTNKSNYLECAFYGALTAAVVW